MGLGTHSKPEALSPFWCKGPQFTLLTTWQHAGCSAVPPSVHMHPGLPSLEASQINTLDRAAGVCRRQRLRPAPPHQPRCPPC